MEDHEKEGVKDLENLTQDQLFPFDEGLQFPEIAGLDDLLAKNYSEISDDIINIQPSPLESSHNSCDQLHGGQHQEQELRKREKIPANIQQTELRRPNIDLEPASHNRKFVQPRNNQSFQPSCLPDSPPDSGSEPYSPTQEAHLMRFGVPQSVQVYTNQMQQNEISPHCDYRVEKYSTNSITSPTGSSSSYEHSPTNQYDNRLSIEGMHQSTSMLEYSSGNETQFSAIPRDSTAMYNEGDPSMRYASSSLSPGSTNSDGSCQSSMQSMTFPQGAPVSKKRKHSESPPGTLEHLNASLLNQQYHSMIQQQIKQEPDLNPSATTDARRAAYFNNAYETTETQGNPSIPMNVNHPLAMNGSAVHHPQSNPLMHNERSLSTSNPQTQYSDSSTYQVIKWSPFVRDTWGSIYDSTGKELQTVSYRVDADKGFNFAVADDTFVCQKKNHFQVTVHIGVVGHPSYVKTEEGLRQIDAFYINLYGVKFESQNQTIAIEQSQSDRSKKAFHPVKVDLPGDQVTKVTIGRLHFSETTTNNMRKKGRPNPEQRYFMCIVALYAQSGGKSYTVAAAGTEKIIVRASNPGQFDQDDIQWQRAQFPDAIYHHGRVGINYDHPDEALVVHGNVKITGHLMQPSDRRAKEGIQEVDTKNQLENVANIRICRYNYSPEYAVHAGIDSNRVETGVIAQELACVMPDAVRETGDVTLENGETIPKFLVVDKDRLYMENVGAVKQIYKMTTNFEERIDELERWNNKLKRNRKYDSFRSDISGLTTPSLSRIGSARKPTKARSSGGASSTSGGRNGRKNTSNHPKKGCMSNTFVQAMVIGLVVIMAFSVVAMSTLYIVNMHHKEEQCTTCVVDNRTKIFSVIAMASLYILELKSDNQTETDSEGNVSGSDGIQNTSQGIYSSPTHYSTKSFTTLTTNPGKQPKNPPPIKYCPENHSACVSSMDFCCTGKPAGKTLSEEDCPRVLRVGADYLENLMSHTSSTPVVTTFPGKKSPKPRDFEGNAKKNHFSHTGLRSHKNGGKYKNVNIEDAEYEPDYQHLPPLNSIINMDNGNSDDKVVDQSPIIKPVIRELPDFATKKREKLNKIKKGRSEDDIGELEANRHRVHNINRRSVANDDTDFENNVVGLNSLILVEPNVELHNDSMGTTGYSLCEMDRANYTYKIPVDKATATNVPITLRFSLSSPANVILCGNISKESCPDANLQKDQSNITQKNGKTVKFVLDFTNYVTADYIFRVTTASDLDTMCEAPDSACGSSYTEYRLHFYRLDTMCTPVSEPMQNYGDYV